VDFDDLLPFLMASAASQKSRQQRLKKQMLCGIVLLEEQMHLIW
jgi:hypothetical protein